MILNIVTQTHNRRNIFLKNFLYNFKKISNYIENIDIKINWIINCDDQTVKKTDIDNYKHNKINIYFFEKTNYFPKRYFELMLIKKADLIWCLEDDDIIFENFFDLISPKYNSIFYYESCFEKINENIKINMLNKKINLETWQLSQIVMRYKDIKKFFYLKKLKTPNFFKAKDYIEYDEEIINYILTNNLEYKIFNKKIFYQNIFGDNMSINDLKKWS